MRWYRKAADQGSAAAQFFLGAMYAKGHGVPQDYAEALRWYSKSADQGSAEAQFIIGHMYYKGWGVAQDYVQAHMWFNLAAARFSDKNDREKAVAARETVAAKMTPEMIAEARALAANWKPKGE
jgi:TPR repeat protein